MKAKSMAAGAAMAVVGWWTGYKLGGVISLITAEYFQTQGLKLLANTFLILGYNLVMNIGALVY